MRQEFRAGAPEYGLAPLLYWNDDLSEREIYTQLQMLKGKHIHEFMIFPMAGLTIPYLSEEYFDKFRFTVKIAGKMGMKVWIYDDFAWPSGLAGGIINEQFPEFLMKVCRFFHYNIQTEQSRNVKIELPKGTPITVTARKAYGSREICLMDCLDQNHLNWQAPSGAWQIDLAMIDKTYSNLDTVTVAPWARELPGYLDVLNKEAVGKFIELVYEAHYQAIPDSFGKSIRGFFTDEPGFWYDSRLPGKTDVIETSAGGSKITRGLYPITSKKNNDPELYGFSCAIPWTDKLPQQFNRKYGYDLLPELVKLADAGEGNRALCYDYFSLVSDMFAQNYCSQIGEWCGKHKVAYSGHYGENLHQGDHYKQIKPQQVPGMDLLGNPECVIRLFPLPRKVSAAAKIHGRDRVLCETYGCSPWTNELSDRIREAELLAVLGADLQAPIDFNYSIRGFRKYVSNPPGFYQSSNWKYQEYFSYRIARLCRMVSSGKSAVNTAILHPTEESLSQTLVDEFCNFQISPNIWSMFNLLRENQIEADVVADTALPDLKCRNGLLLGKKVSYQHLCLPLYKMISKETLTTLDKFVKEGGTIALFGTIPLTAPNGETISGAWQKMLSSKRINHKISFFKDIKYGKGRIIIVPDSTEEITLSSNPQNGEKLNIFKNDSSLLCLSVAGFPHTIDLNFRSELKLKSFSFRVEKPKSHLRYIYEVQTSNNGKNWEKCASAVKKGREHYLDLKGRKAKHLRIKFLEGGNRILGIEHVQVTYLDVQDHELVWLPPKLQYRNLGTILPEAQEEIKFYEVDKLANCMVLNFRREKESLICSAINILSEEKSVTIKIPPNCFLEYWDLDTGKTALLGNADEIVPIHFAPWETKVLVLQKGKSKKNKIDLAGIKGKTTKLAGLWDFNTERANAFPLAADKIEMFNSANRKWLLSHKGRIPVPIRKVEKVKFRSTFIIKKTPENEKLLLERGLYSDFEINGRKVKASPRSTNYYDRSNRILNIGKYLKSGKNVISGRFSPPLYERFSQGAMYQAHNVQPSVDLIILGNFSVVKNKIVTSIRKVDHKKTWQEQGFPYYSGTAIYSTEFSIPEYKGKHYLKIDCHGEVVEVKINGKNAGVRARSPFNFDLTGYLKQGYNSLEIKLTNSLASLFSSFLVSECFNNLIKNVGNGLKSIEIISPKGNP